MVSPAATVKSIDSVINQTAQTFFEYIKPNILLVGEWDDIFDDIKEYFQWAVHANALPGTLSHDLALVVVNSRALAKDLRGRVDPGTVVIVYDQTQIIPIKDRCFDHSRIVCYLHHLSPRYIRGHIRTLLQLRKCTVCIHENVPYLLTNESDYQTFNLLIRHLDKSQIAYVKTDSEPYFFHIFKEIVKLTHYESALFIDNIDDVTSTDAYEVTTLVIKVESKAQLEKCLALDLAPFSVLFVSTKHIFNTVPKDSVFSVDQLLTSKETYHLTGYFYSLFRNLIDEEHRTRFIQAGDMDTFREQSSSLVEFVGHLDHAFTAHTLRFRNIPVRIHDVPFCKLPLESLMDQLEFAVLNELMNQTNNSQELAELVSGIQRLVLVNRISRLG